MAQSGFTPIKIFSSTTPAAAPSAANLEQGELAINTNDGKLFYEDSSGVVQVMATKDTTAGNFATVDINGGTIDGTTVGATTPSTVASTNLSYTGTLTGSTGVVNLGSGQVFKDASGNVGIGTSSPLTKFEVQGGRSTFTANSEQFSVGARFSSAGGSVYFGAASASATPDTVFSAATGDERMRITNAGNVGIGTTNAAPANGKGMSINGGSITRIDLRTTTSGDASGDGTSLQLNGNNFTIENRESGFVAFATSLVERMRIDTSGNAGIGTSSPVGRLAVVEANRIFDTFGNINVLTSDAATVGAGGSIAFCGNNATDGPSPYMFAKIQGIKEGSASTYNGALLFGTTAGSSALLERMRIDSSGNLLVGTTSAPDYVSKLRVNGGIETHGVTQFNMVGISGSTFEWVLRTGSTQSFYVNNASVVATLSITGVWTNASDARYKENIVESGYGLSTVMALKPRAYNLIGQADKPQIGFIAQEVLDVLPEVVDSTYNSITKEERYTLSYGQMSAVLVKAIQELKAEFDAYKLSHL